jgi:hypothetical protein
MSAALTLGSAVARVTPHTVPLYSLNGWFRRDMQPRMSRRMIAFGLLAACAQGNRAVSDAPPGDPIDAKDVDGAIDPPHPDAMVDAAVPHPDAFVPPPDAFIPPPDACVPQVTELLANPVFDLSPVGTGWQQTLIDPAYPLITADDGLVEQSAPYKAWLGGIEPDSGTATDVLWQDFAVPANTTSLVLTGYYAVGTLEDPSDPNVYDTGSVDLTSTNGTPLQNVLSINNTTTTTTWVAFSKTFTGNYSGMTIRLRATTSNDPIAPFPLASGPTSLFLDTLSLKATHGCP